MSDISVNFEPSPQAPANQAGPHVDHATSDSESEKNSSCHATEFILMQRLANGDETAMNALLELHGEMLARLVGRLTAWNADHEDVFQEVLLIIWQKASSYRGNGSLEGWLRRLAANRCYNQLRRQNSVRRMLTRFIDFQRNVEPIATSHEPSSAMRNGLRKLKVNERAVLVLFYLEEMSGEQVANALRIKTESLHVRLHRARQKLMSFLSTEGVT